MVMNSKSIIQVLGSLEELNISQYNEDCSKIRIFRIDSKSYGLLLYSTNEKRISFFKLHLSKLLHEGAPDAKSLKDNRGKELYKLILLNVFYLSFNVIDIICTTENIWTVGYKSVLNLKPYIKSALENFKSEEDDKFMDTDDVQEFNNEIFAININVLESNNCFHDRPIFIGCDFIDNGFVLCHKNAVLGRWQLELVLVKNTSSLSSDYTLDQFLNFPVSFDNDISTCSLEDDKEVCVPVIVFIHYNDPERLICENLFGISCLPSNAVCLVCHPNGELLWTLCDYKNKFQASEKLQTFLDTKQPIVGVYFFDAEEESKDSGCMLIVGSLGQVTLVSPKKRNSFSAVSGHSFWIRTCHLKSSVMDCIIVNKCLLCLSRDGTLAITQLSKLIDSNETDKDFCFEATSSTELSCILQMIPIAGNQGLTVLKTSSGNLYLTLCLKDESNFSNSSLPLLMNEGLIQSISMQELLRKKVLQSRLFAAISTFATLKFSENILDEPITFSISELNLQPRKYLLVINFQCFTKLHLDPELCHVSANVFTHVKGNNTLLSKTIAYNPDEPTLCLELIDTVLQPPFFSIFPLLVEIGLVLQLPYEWKSVDCFQTLSTCLPFYLRIHTFMVHELHLFHSNTLCSPQSLKLRKPKTLQKVQELASKRPISNVLKVESDYQYTVPVKFNLCLAASSVEEMMKSTGDSDPCAFVERLLFGNKKLDSPSEGIRQISKTSPASATVIKKGNTIVITVHASSLEPLIAFRVAVMDILLSYRNQVECSADPSTHVHIPASIYRRCEELSKTLMDLYGQDVESREVTQSLLQVYRELRTDVSAQLPIL